MIGRWKRNPPSQREPADQPTPGSQPVPGPLWAPPVRHEVPPGTVEQLDRGLALLMEFTRDDSIPASILVNPLLVVWEAARDVGIEVSGPVEAMLTAAVRRSTLTADEVRSCVHEVRALALQETVLSVLVGG